MLTGWLTSNDSFTTLWKRVRCSTNQKYTKFLLNLSFDDKPQHQYTPFFREEAEQFDTHVTVASADNIPGYG